MHQSVTNIFEYLNSLDPNIYSDICLYHFLDTNIFGYSFVSTFVRIKILIRISSDIRLFQKKSYEYIRIFVRVIFLTQIYSDIHSCQNPYECHTLVWDMIIAA